MKSPYSPKNKTFDIVKSKNKESCVSKRWLKKSKNNYATASEALAVLLEEHPSINRAVLSIAHTSHYWRWKVNRMQGKRRR